LLYLAVEVRVVKREIAHCECRKLSNVFVAIFEKRQKAIDVAGATKGYQVQCHQWSDGSPIEHISKVIVTTTQGIRTDQRPRKSEQNAETCSLEHCRLCFESPGYLMPRACEEEDG
jgi:hypothetical protein